MEHSAFKLGMKFKSGAGLWLVTDIGTRTIVAIQLNKPDDTSWYNGPPYAIPEIVFDEYDIEGCEEL